jgi:tetratricopeptide (TPR) repeat protein
VPEEVESELRQALGPGRARRLLPRLGEAVRAYEADRYGDALRALRPLASAVPDVGAVRELLGLTLYRMGRWSAAIGELEAFRALTGSLDQHPVLADCHRALGNWAAVEELWDDLRRASPSGELVAEGRIVVAGALADRGDLAGAIRLLERSPSARKRLHPHHLRVSYALADLYERSGDVARARELMRSVADHDPDFADVSERLAALS